MHRGLGQLVAGATIGLALAIAISWLTTRLPIELQQGGIGLLGVVALAIVGAGFLACLIPAYRALAIEPTVALRCE